MVYFYLFYFFYFVYRQSFCLMIIYKHFIINFFFSCLTILISSLLSSLSIYNFSLSYKLPTPPLPPPPPHSNRLLSLFIFYFFLPALNFYLFKNTLILSFFLLLKVKSNSILFLNLLFEVYFNHNIINTFTTAQLFCCLNSLN